MYSGYSLSMKPENKHEIDAFYPTLRRLFDLKMDQKHGETRAILNEQFQNYFNITSIEAEPASIDDVLDIMIGETPVREARIMIASLLYKELADSYIYNGEIEYSRNLFFKSLQLFLQVYDENPDFDFHGHIAILPELTNRIPAIWINDDMTRKVEEIFDTVE